MVLAKLPYMGGQASDHNNGRFSKRVMWAKMRASG